MATVEDQTLREKYDALLVKMRNGDGRTKHDPRDEQIAAATKGWE